jgi:L-iditol 2-dehydrogenase
MSEKMKAFVLHGIGDMRLEELPVPTPNASEALVRIKSVGVCGSDVHFYRHGRIGSFVVKAPMILGHECSGEVVAIGKGVKNVTAGDRVVIEPGVPCQKCWYCKNGRYALCRDVKFMATPPHDGSLVEYVAWPAEFLYKMPASMSFEEGALIEPFAVGLNAARRSGLQPSASVAILGAGPIGLATLEAVKAMGAGSIIVVDVMPNRLRLAREMGATHVLDAKEGDAVKKIHDLTGGEGAHFVFEAAGSAKTVQQTVDVVRSGGVVVLVGMPQEEEIPIPVIGAIVREINFVTNFRYSNVFEESIALIEHGRVNVKPMMTHQFPFAQTLEAFHLAETGKERAVKVTINF